MKITIIGTGNMGSALAEAIAHKTKHRISVRASSPKSKSALELSRRLNVPVATDAEALESDTAPELAWVFQ
jgi:pyrroline-5-carboxylate reductase